MFNIIIRLLIVRAQVFNTTEFTFISSLCYGKCKSDLRLYIYMDQCSYSVFLDQLILEISQLENIRVYAVGFRVGQSFSRNLLSKLSAESAVELMKFVCRQLWNGLFGHQVSKLLTNRQGTFELYDNEFCQKIWNRPFYSGLIQGCIKGLHAYYQCSVEATNEVNDAEQDNGNPIKAKFTVHLK
ncbi:hypothetical protein GJ496_006304 [Pomphorhynchus laevis]|nr:hypothetical protein GJ496_006304 [Pomphorhynchus laevis]